MSSHVEKYIVRYDNNDGTIGDKNIYCKHENVWNGQLWVNEDGTPLDFGCVTDNEAYVIACCIIGISVNDKYCYWKEIKKFELPEAVCKVFNYKYPQTIKE